MKTISVTKAASKGIVMGKAFLVVQQNLEADKKLIRDSEKEIEIKKFEKAVKDTEIGRASVGTECVCSCRSRWSPYH